MEMIEVAGPALVRHVVWVPSKTRALPELSWREAHDRLPTGGQMDRIDGLSGFRGRASAVPPDG
jgi:hypothetical protein